MEIRITTKQILNVLLILAWIIFIGLCVETGAVLCGTLYTLIYKPAAGILWERIDLTPLYHYDMGHFLVENLLIIIPAILKALLFYLIVKILQEKKLDMVQPFNKTLGRFIFSIAYLAIGIGIFSGWGTSYTKWLMGKGIKLPDIEYLNLDGGDVWLFMAVVLFVIGQIFKRGIEIQDEHELTV